MMTVAFEAVALYAGLLALMLLGLGANVVRRRQAAKVFMGDGGDKGVVRALREQANFVEYVPLALVQLTLTAALGAPAWLIHLFGLPLLAARAVHAWHFVQDDAPGWQRFWGTLITWIVMGLLGLGLIAHALI